jgi:hypothetical protein
MNCWLLIERNGTGLCKCIDFKHEVIARVGTAAGVESRTAGQKLVFIRKVLRPANATKFFPGVFLSLRAAAVFVPKFDVDAAKPYTVFSSNSKQQQQLQ